MYKTFFKLWAWSYFLTISVVLGMLAWERLVSNTKTCRYWTTQFWFKLNYHENIQCLTSWVVSKCFIRNFWIVFLSKLSFLKPFWNIYKESFFYCFNRDGLVHLKCRSSPRFLVISSIVGKYWDFIVAFHIAVWHGSWHFSE